MIGKVTKGRGFVGLGQYLESGSNGVSPDRVDWIESRNLPTADPRTAAILMRATAHESDRVEKPVYHVSVSFDAGDRADRETMSRIADRVIADLGLDEHQVLIVAHRDKDHPHLHMMVNRVHPETGRAWDDGHDYGRIERSLREQERELGMREVPGHHHQLDGQERPARSEGLTTGQLRMWERTGNAPFDELVRSTVSRDFNEAASWADLERRLMRHGLRVESKQAGLIITDGVEVVRASDIGPTFSRHKLEQRFGVMYGDPKKTEAAAKPATLRERLKKSSAQPAAPLSPEMTEKLIALPEKLDEVGENIVQRLNETAERSALRLSEIVEVARQSSRSTEDILPRLSELREHMTETERNVAYQVERLKRQADRTQWMQTGVILLALVAGLLGGIGAALAMLNWVR